MGLCARFFLISLFCARANHCLATLAAATLEMKSEKQNAHGRLISSVSFNHDGTAIVSACYGGTIKVWDSGT